MTNTSLPQNPGTLSFVATDSRRVARCPFHDGVATLDLLLAEIDPSETVLFDAVLDLRSLCRAGSDAETCIAQIFRVRRQLDGRHFLAFYRVRCWARRALRVEVRRPRGEWISSELPVDGGRLEEIVYAAVAPLADDGVIPGLAQVRFVFVAHS